MENFSKNLVQYCINRGLSISIAESCTGGMIVSKLISIPGASKVIDCGLVTYSNKAKQIYLDVPKILLKKTYIIPSINLVNCALETAPTC